TNEELQTMNDELRRRTDEVAQANSFLNSILTSLRGGVIVVNPDLLVQVWNERAQDLWGLRSDEVRGRNLLNLDIGLPVHELRQTIRDGLAQQYDYREVTVLARNRRGKDIQCRVMCTPLFGVDHTVQGVILVMEEEQPGREDGARLAAGAEAGADGGSAKKAG